MKPLLIAALLISFSGSVQAQSSNPIDIKGHSIGESVGDFLRAEPEAQQEADVCQDRPSRATCARLIAAMKRGGRAEVSTSDGADFVLDAGRLVKVTLLVHGDSQAAAAQLTEKFGQASNDKTIPAQNGSGAKWQNHQLAWSTQSVYATLYEDNNPLLQNREPVMIVESQAEHILEGADLAQKTQALEASQVKR